MNYIFHYSLTSSIFLVITYIFYSKQKRVPNFHDKLYKILLVAAFLSAFCDSITSIAEINAILWPKFVLYFFNIVLQLSMQLILPMFTLYAIIMTGRYQFMNRKHKIQFSIPYIIDALIILSSAFWKHGVFYIDDNHLYRSGSLHFSLYIFASFYFIICIIIIIKRYSILKKRAKTIIYIFLSLNVITMIMQMLFPKYLLISTGTALGLVVMYFEIQTPQNHIDPVTNIYNGAALPVIIQDSYEKHQIFTLIIIQLNSFRLIANTYGEKTLRQLILQFSDYLEKKFSGHCVFHISSETFGVIYNGKFLEENEIMEIHKTIPTDWNIATSDVQIGNNIFVVYSKNNTNSNDVLSMMNFVINEDFYRTTDSVVIADESVYQEFNYFNDVQKAVIKSIKNHSIGICFQPVFNTKWEVTSLEALSRITDDVIGVISPDVFIRNAEITGDIIEVGQQVLEKVCSSINENNIFDSTISYVSINFSMVQCMQNKIYKRILDTVNRYGIEPSRICFEIRMSDAMTVFPIVEENISNLSNAGFKFVIDDFGSGFAKFGEISKFPFIAVKIDKKLLWDAVKSEKSKSLFSGIKDILNFLELNTICKGIENQEQNDLCDELNITLRQGFFYSKSILESDMKKFLKTQNKY